MLFYPVKMKIKHNKLSQTTYKAIYYTTNIKNKP